MTNNINTTATENIIKAYIMEADYIGNIFEDETDYCKDKFVITGNSRLLEYGIKNDFFENVVNLITDIECYYDMEAENDRQELATNYNITLEQLEAVNNVINEVCYPEVPKNICRILNIISNDTYDTKTIRGYSQSDWNEIIYNTAAITPDDLNIIESYYFGKYSDVKIVDSDFEYWNTILHEDVWKEDPDLIRTILDLPETAEIYLENGKTETINFRKIS